MRGQGLIRHSVQHRVRARRRAHRNGYDQTQVVPPEMHPRQTESWQSVVPLLRVTGPAVLHALRSSVMAPYRSRSWSERHQQQQSNRYCVARFRHCFVGARVVQGRDRQWLPSIESDPNVAIDAAVHQDKPVHCLT